MGSLLKQCHIHLRNFNTWGKQDDRFMKNVSTDIAQAVRSKQVSAVEVTQADLEKIESVNLTINAVVQEFRAEALLAEKVVDDLVAKGKELGVLCGVPILMKVNVIN